VITCVRGKVRKSVRGKDILTKDEHVLSLLTGSWVHCSIPGLARVGNFHTCLFMLSSAYVGPKWLALKWGVRTRHCQNEAGPCIVSLKIVGLQRN
jgi:hypothetical protein